VAARESANLSRMQPLTHFAFASLRRRPVPGLRRKRAFARNDERGEVA
jgi:hypothetical protein